MCLTRYQLVLHQMMAATWSTEISAALFGGGVKATCTSPRSRCIEFSRFYPHGSYPPPHLNGLASYWRRCGFSAKIGHPQDRGGAVCHRKVISSTRPRHKRPGRLNRADACILHPVSIPPTVRFNCGSSRLEDQALHSEISKPFRLSRFLLVMRGCHGR